MLPVIAVRIAPLIGKTNGVRRGREGIAFLRRNNRVLSRREFDLVLSAFNPMLIMSLRGGCGCLAYVPEGKQ